ncbi:MAG: sucrase ferredoxin [Chloroflexi bacterium]|nr:sucrase ferredoxin [Chloroflexota bacterium]
MMLPFLSQRKFRYTSAEQVDFQREDNTMMPYIPPEEPIAATVKPYERHLVACTGRSDWPGKIDDEPGFLSTFSLALERARRDLPLRYKFTASPAPSQTSGIATPISGTDLLSFPDMTRYHGVREADIPDFISEVLVAGQKGERWSPISLSGRYLLVCIHSARDERCGLCGPKIAAALAQEIQAHGLAGNVHILQSSHVGGHRFAGNVLVYPEGVWFGHVTADTAPRLVENYLLQGQDEPQLWRGRMDLSLEQQTEQAHHWGIQAALSVD